MPSLSPRRSQSTAPPRSHRPERELRNAILECLRAHGIAAWSTGVGAFPATYLSKRGRYEKRFVRVGTVGMSDIVGIVPQQFANSDEYEMSISTVGCFLAIEVKNPGGKVSAQQTAFLQTVVNAGGIGFVAHSVDEVMRKLSLLTSARPAARG